jgi:pimeloyl-ACP methyl ester carboxylesterase
MRKFGFRQHMLTGQECQPDQEYEQVGEVGTSITRDLAPRPQLLQATSAESAASHKESLFENQPRVGLRGRPASFANSIFPGHHESAPHNQIPDLLGLQLLYDRAEPTGDIIFVHGLGGTAMRTWSWNRDISYFWPVWLAEDPDLSSFRIFSFGYNSNFKGAGTNLNTIDFAKDLLFSMLTFSGALGQRVENRTAIGSKPIIFVAHSMGGLVVKKAYVLGKHDKIYAELVASVHGIIFLATPHRGAQYAKMLNNILSTAPLGAPPKAYISELDSSSSSLQDINEQFRICCESLMLTSFFETQKTNFGVTKLLVCIILYMNYNLTD